MYCSSKGAVIQLVRTLGLEWAKHGVTVNNVAPTFAETNLATPEEVAAAVVYLASEEARMVNCATLSVDGGWTAW